jgi:hypothetical protein
MEADIERLRIKGRCHCGKTGYEAEINPDNVIICHCTDCQAISGAPYRANVPVLIANFKPHGAPKTYVKTADSGRRVVLTFCGDCGSALYSSRLEEPAVYNLRLGAVKERAQLVPKSQGFCQSAMPWAMDLHAIPQVAPSARRPRGPAGAT